jgi:signal peptidase I
MPIVQGAKEYKVGDIIVFSVKGARAPIIHRVIKINRDGTYQTKGDHNSGQLNYELSVKKDQIHGKVIFIIPKLGYFKVIISKIFGVV